MVALSTHHMYLILWHALLFVLLANRILLSLSKLHPLIPLGILLFLCYTQYDHAHYLHNELLNIPIPWCTLFHD